MNRTSPRMDEQLAWMIARVNRRLEEELADRLKPGGVPIEQFRILETLAQRGPQPMGALAAAALVEKPTLTKIVDRMVAAGLVFREPDEQDRRRVNIALAPEGSALYARLDAVSAEQERRIAELLDGDDERARSFMELLRALS